MVITRKTLRRNKGGKGRSHNLTRKLNHNQVGRGEGDDSEESSGIVQMFSLTNLMGGSNEPQPETKTEIEPSSSEPEAEPEPEPEPEAEPEVEAEPEPEAEPEEPQSVGNVSGIQRAFEGYYGVSSGDVGNTPPENDHANMHNNMIEKNENGHLVFKQDIPTDTVVAVLYRASIGFKKGVERMPVCNLLKDNEYPESPPNVVVDMTKLPIRVADRNGVYVKVFSLVLKTTEEVLKGTRVNLSYVPSFAEHDHEPEESVVVSESVRVPDQGTEEPDIVLESVRVPDEESEVVDENYEPEEEDMRMGSEDIDIDEDDLLEAISNPQSSLQDGSEEPNE
jgi:hypothetical protein